jgi:hypothetical protein
VLEGSLESNVEKNLKSELASECDRTWGSKALEIARALDSRQSEISKMLESQPPSNFYRRVPLPPTYAREWIGKIETKPGWQEDAENWEDIYNAYLTIKDHPTDLFWGYLNTNARSIISDDHDRLEGYSNVYFDKDAIPRMEKIVQEIGSCIEAVDCATFTLSPDEEAFVKVIASYSSYWQQIQQQADPSKKRESAKAFTEQMKSDLTTLGFRVNKSVSMKNGELILPLDPGPFSVSTELLSKTIESIWNSESLKLKIQWTSSNTTPDIFRILLGDTPGERAFVQRYDKTVHLFPNVRLKSIAHEIGHVLGFKDHYYTVWHPEKCGYITQSNAEDLMSDSDTGVVTPEEWSELKTRYSQ